MRRILAAVALSFALASSAFAQRTAPPKHSAAPAIQSAAPTEHVEGAKHEEGAHEHELGPINWFDFTNKEQPPWATYAINLGLLAFLYWYFGKDAVKKGLADRRTRIQKEMEEAQKLLDEAQAREKKYKRKLKELDADIEQAKKGLADAGASERDRIIREAKEKAARMERDAHFLVEQELKQMHNDVVRETLDATVRGAEELLGKSIGPADQERLAEEYLTQLASLGTLDARKEVRS
jgi:F-type H+-transporting ATPase subunit b